MHFRYTTLSLLILLLSLALGGCGENDKTGSLTALLGASLQDISFATPGPIQKTYGDAPFSNTASGGDGRGAIRYDSSNTAVASVAATSGAVTLVAPGTTVITATKAADRRQLAAQASYTLTVARADQSIAFNNAGPLYKLADEASFSNLAGGGSGSGALSYSSNNTAVAMVDATTGAVTPVAPGSATITAIKAADTYYNSAQASYSVVMAPRETQLKAWLGAANTEVEFPATADGLSFVRATDADCDLSNYSVCADGQLDMLTGITINDSAARLNQQGWYWLQHGVRDSASLNVTQTRFSTRQYLQTAVFNDKLWLIGGYDGSFRNDVWSSNDGVNWTQVSANAGFSARSDHQVVSFNGKLWVIGGWDGSMKNDVWSSSDGVNWTQETAAAGFSARYAHHAAVFDNKLWVIAGWDGGTNNDVWYSSDGSNWTQATAAAAFSARVDAQVTVFDNKLWLIGGWDGSVQNDVWWSSDGIS